MNGVITPPPSMSPTMGTDAPAAYSEKLLALLDDSDDEKDAAPSFYYQPNLADSPEKPTTTAVSKALAAASSTTPSPTLTETDSSAPKRASRGSLTRSTYTTEPVREPRTFTRVASVPVVLRSQKTLDNEDVESEKRRYSGDVQYDPETPAPLAALPRRTATTVSRPHFPSTAPRTRDVPAVTPGLSSRYNNLTSISSNKVLPLRRTGSSSPTTTPESDNVLPSKSDQESSPESVLSPRVSPNGAGMSASTLANYNRNRVTSGRLGTAPPIRGRKGTGATLGSTPLEETDEDVGTPERQRDAELEMERRRLSLEQRREVERQRAAERDSDMEAEIELALRRERDQREKELDRGAGYKGRSSPPRRDSGGYEYAIDDQDAHGSPTQRDYGYGSSTAGPSRARAASSSEYRVAVTRPPSSMSHHVDQPAHQRAASSLDHYASRQAPKAVARLTRPVPASSSNAEADGLRPRSRGRLQAAATEAPAPSSSTLRPQPQPLSRQGSAASAANNFNGGTTATATVMATGTRHRRNPTDPSPPMMRMVAEQAKENQSRPNSQVEGVTWGYGSREEAKLKELTNRDMEEQQEAAALKEKEERERERQRYAAPPPQPAVTPNAAEQAQINGGRKMNHTIMVHRKAYQRLECIGRGGSSRVYRVVSPENAIYAIKRVSLENADQATIESYRNEIELLKRLEGNKRIIKLVEFDSSSKKSLLMVMECGEVDLARLLVEKQGEPVDFPWVTSYWQQMLQAVQVIHEEKIVHSDLKPANFVLVKGSLKLIDFGIAKAIPNDTTNIQREQQIGTVNYMSPEAIQGSHTATHRLPNGMPVMKLGRASDVWSLGCILYQMIYGQAPFYHLTMWQKMSAIPDNNHVIEFPAIAVPCIPGPRDPHTGQAGPPQRLMEHATEVPPGIIRTMRNCLQRDPKARPSIPDLLAEKWNMNPQATEPQIPSRSDSPTPFLAPDEAVINKNMMLQLMSYTLRSVPQNSTPEQLEEMVASLLPRLREAREHHHTTAS